MKNKVHALIDRNGLQSQEKFSDLFGKSGVSWLKIVWTMLSRREPYESRNTKRYEHKLNMLS